MGTIEYAVIILTALFIILCATAFYYFNKASPVFKAAKYWKLANTGWMCITGSYLLWVAYFITGTKVLNNLPIIVLCAGIVQCAYAYTRIGREIKYVVK